MNKLEELEKRFHELVGTPRTEAEVEETLRIAEELELVRAEETSEMLLELKNVGVSVKSVWDLVNTSASYPTAIPILVGHFSQNYHIKNKEGIIRALAVKEAIGKAGRALINEYHKTPKKEETLRWVMGNSIFMTITKEDVNNVLQIVQNKDNGGSRGMFVAALGKVKSEIIEDALIKLLDDEEVAPQALDALGRLRSQRAKEKIQPLLRHSNSLIRLESQKALKKINKA